MTWPVTRKPAEDMKSKEDEFKAALAEAVEKKQKKRAAYGEAIDKELAVLGEKKAFKISQIGTGDWNTTVKAIQSYDGSAKFWQPVKQKLSAYAAAPSELTLDVLKAAIDKWRDNQANNRSLNERDLTKAMALRRLEELINEKTAKSGVSQTPPVSTTQQIPAQQLPVSTTQQIPAKTSTASTAQTSTMSTAQQIPVSTTQQVPVSTKRTGIGSGQGEPGAAKKGSKSFQDALAKTPDTSNLGLVAAVQQQDVEKVDQDKCKVQVAEDGTLRTWDGKHLIDSEGVKIRYVLTVEGEDLGLWASQSFVHTTPPAENTEMPAESSETPDENPEKPRAMLEALNYPILQSHGQIGGQVIGAGDMKVSGGRITEITNQSGTWTPQGKHLARTLKWLVRTGILDENAIVGGKVTVSQWTSRPDGYDVDKGQLYQLLPGGMAGKLASRKEGKVPSLQEGKVPSSQEGKLPSSQEGKLPSQQQDDDTARDDDTPSGGGVNVGDDDIFAFEDDGTAGDDDDDDDDD